CFTDLNYVDDYGYYYGDSW
nr:immunoglobulin heavy chain junction region [Macaca mulatta]